MLTKNAKIDKLSYSIFIGNHDYNNGMTDVTYTDIYIYVYLFIYLFQEPIFVPDPVISLAVEARNKVLLLCILSCRLLRFL